MSKYIAKDHVVVINGVTLSDHAFNLDIKLEKDQVDVSGFNATGSKEFIPGSADEEVTVSFRQNFDSAKVDATLWPLYSGGTPFPVSFKPTSSGGSTTNPVYSGSAYLFEYHPLDAAFGAVSETTATFKLTGGISRGTS